MFEGRALSRAESLLRDATGATNLAASPGTWFEVGPAAVDERWQITSLEVIIAGPGLLGDLGAWQPKPLDLQIGFLVDDGFGQLRDPAASTLHTFSEAAELLSPSPALAAIGSLPIVDPAAGDAHDGLPRAGLRGPDTEAPPVGALTWRSQPQPLRYGQAISAVVWQADLLRNASGGPLGNITLTLEVEPPAGPPAWTPHAIASNPAELALGARAIAPAVTAGRFRWRADFTYASVDAAGFDRRAVWRTGAIYLLGTWIDLAASWWRFERVLDVVSRSTPERLLLPKGLAGGADVMVLRLDCVLDLNGRRRETVRAAIGAGAASLTLLEIAATSRLSHVNEAL